MFTHLSLCFWANHAACLVMYLVLWAMPGFDPGACHGVAVLLRALDLAEQGKTQLWAGVGLHQHG